MIIECRGKSKEKLAWNFYEHGKRTLN